MISKLRHPVRAIREPFGTAGLIVAFIALIAALTGGAYAASGGLTAKQKKEVKKIAKQFGGKPGAPGATGPAGPAGAKGATGVAGTNGINGANGTNGLQGATGEAGMCSGEEPECVAPPGALMTGAWSFRNRGVQMIETEVEGVKNSYEIGTRRDLVTVSYPMRVIPAPEQGGGEQWVLPGGSPTARCPGTVNEPDAAPGYVCWYVNFLNNAGENPTTPEGEEWNLAGDPTSSASFSIFLNEAGLQAWGYGTWAVRAGCPKDEFGEEEECVSGS